MFSYNNTIERVARDLPKDAVALYTVTLGYSSLNFRVNQEMLVNAGALKAVDPSKYWQVQIPSRVPKDWHARIDFISGCESKSPGDMVGATYDQYSQEMASTPNASPGRTARYNLTYITKDGEKGGKEFDGDSYDGLIFRMHQYQYRSEPAEEKEGYGKSANFGDVVDSVIAKTDVIKLCADLKEEVEEYKNSSAPISSEDSGDLFQALRELVPDKLEQKVACEIDHFCTEKNLVSLWREKHARLNKLSAIDSEATKKIEMKKLTDLLDQDVSAMSDTELVKYEQQVHQWLYKVKRVNLVRENIGLLREERDELSNEFGDVCLGKIFKAGEKSIRVFGRNWAKLGGDSKRDSFLEGIFGQSTIKRKATDDALEEESDSKKSK